MKKRFLVLLVAVFMIISLFPAGVYADLGINYQKQSIPHFTISKDELERLAWLNNVDPQELKDALNAGLDENGKYSPFSNLKQLDNGITDEELKKRDLLKIGSDGTPIVRMNPYFSNIVPAGQILRSNQDATAYVAASGKVTASGKTPKYGMVAVHFAGGNPVNPVIPFGTAIYLDRYISLPDGTQRSNYTVEDTGSGHEDSTLYWIDLFFGGLSNYPKAINFGTQTVTYNQIVN
ncbi:MAG: hypothetical protein K0R07_333 [Sedimentibacter sp.]|jgi:3D (Asp-Asp-Asp) domain-containing protein|nr:hypothetical protein [Sedimentibacter sp.]